MTKIFGSMVMYNEADRYLRPVLKHMSRFFDELFVYDDQSDDDSRKIAGEFGAVSVVRQNATPSFLQHEGHFRHGAWMAFESAVQPNAGDWVLSFDADEFLVGRENDFSDVRDRLNNAIAKAEDTGSVGVVLPFPEIFDVHDGIPQQRVDGLWPSIRGPRLFKYLRNGEWSQKEMGCGSEPTYVSKGKVSTACMDLHMLHFGYANPAEHAAKHKRYSELYDHGHNNSHIQSIIQRPILQAWSGPIPEFTCD